MERVSSEIRKGYRREEEEKFIFFMYEVFVKC